MDSKSSSCHFLPVVIPDRPDFDRLYKVCCCGEHFRGVRSGKDLKIRKDETGYMSVYMHNQDYTHSITPRIHVLITRAFIPNDDPEKKWVDHINRIKVDNDVNNLRWVTTGENNDNRDKSTQFKRKVIKVDKFGNILKLYDSCAEAARDNDICPKSLSSRIRGMAKYFNCYDEYLRYVDCVTDDVIYPEDEIWKNIGVLTLYNNNSKLTNTYDFSKYEISSWGSLRNMRGKIFKGI